MKRTRQVRPRETRERLLGAAMDAFAAKGYHGTAVDDIVAGSQTSKGAFYHHFPNKQGIFLTLMDQLAALVEQGAEAAIAVEDGALAKVDAALRVVLETAAAQRDLAKILLVESVGLGPELEQRRLEIHRRFAGVIRRHLDRAVSDAAIPPQDTALAAQAWIGALNEVITQWLVQTDGDGAAGGQDLTARLPALRALLLRSIGAAEISATAPEAIRPAAEQAGQPR